MDQKMEQVDIFLYLHPKRIGKIKEGAYKYTLSCRGQQITGEERTPEYPCMERKRMDPGRKSGTAQCRPLETGGQAVYGTCSAFQNRKNGLNTKGEHDVREIWRNEFIHRDQ